VRSLRAPVVENVASGLLLAIISHVSGDYAHYENSRHYSVSVMVSYVLRAR
jgi:hypothetical protein